GLTTPIASVVYVVYWGAAEPLGRSLVLPSIVALARAGVRLTLVTFEKRSDLEDAATLGEIRSRLGDAGARWVPLRYHKRPKWPATAADIAAGVIRCVA